MTSAQQPPATTLPHRKSGLPDLRNILRNPRRRGLRGGGSLPVVWLCCFSITAFLSFFASPVQALEFPALTGRVVDEANVLDSAQRAALTARLAAFEEKTTDQ